MAVTDYSTTASSNTSISGVDVSENCAPAGLNDAIRQLMADIRTFYDATPSGVIGTDIQAYDAALQSLSNLTLAANKGLYSTGADTVALFDLTAAARTLLDDATVGDMLTTLGAFASADVLDEDDMVTDSATKPPSQQSVAAYVATQVSGINTPDYSTQVAVGTAVSAAHGLGALPGRVRHSLICVTTDNGYAVGDIIPFTAGEGDSARSTTAWYNATEIGMGYNGDFLITPKAGGSRFSAISANWEFLMEAWE